MTEFAVTAQVRNHHLWRAVEQLGSQRQLADHLDVCLQTLNRWVNLRGAPNLNDQLTRDQLSEKLFNLTQRTLEEIFPEEVRDKAFQKQKKRFTKYIEADINLLSDAGFAPKQLPAPDVLVASLERKQAIADQLSLLTPREEKVIKMRFGIDPFTHEYRLEDVGLEFGVTRERIRQVEAKALRKLRHPPMSRHLKHFMEEPQ